MISDRYNIENLKKAFNNPRLAIEVESRKIHRQLFIDNPTNSYLHQIFSKTFHFRHSPPEDIIHEDWDNLIILDACRYDTFAETNGLTGELHSKIVASSNSSEFMDNYFSGKNFHDTVYVTGNPHAPDLEEGLFHAIDFVEVDNTTPESTPYPGPPLENQVFVPPEAVLAKCSEFHSKFPSKRIIAHFMQPHLPFLGEFGRRIYTRALREAEENGSTITTNRGRGINPDEDCTVINIFPVVHRSDYSITREDLKSAYIENVEIVLHYIREFIENIDGKTVITSDHGELLGDRILGIRHYGHPHGIRTKELSKVPWFTVESESRREITEEPPVTSLGIEDSTVRKQLTALGYY